MTIEISICDEVTEAVVSAFAKLIPQLSRSAPLPTAEELTDIDAETILGSMTLVLFPIPTGMRAWIEDVVVDESARGRGVGEALNRRALEIAVNAGAKTVDLTSRPSREVANRLYQRLGFVTRETNIYRYEA